MIKINLAQKKKAAPLVNADGSAAGDDLLSKIKGMMSGAGGSTMSPETKAKIITAVVALVLGYGATLAWDDYRTKELEAVRAQTALLQAELQRLESEVAKTAGFQVLKQKLEEDEKAMKLKIETIERLMSERRDPPAILKTLSEIMPKEIWLTDFQLGAANVKIQGGSRGLTPVSDFMRTLEETVYFKEVSLKKSTAKRDQGVDIADFQMEAKRK